MTLDIATAAFIDEYVRWRGQTVWFSQPTLEISPVWFSQPTLEISRRGDCGTFRPMTIFPAAEIEAYWRVLAVLPVAAGVRAAVEALFRAGVIEPIYEAPGSFPRLADAR